MTDASLRSDNPPFGDAVPRFELRPLKIPPLNIRPELQFGMVQLEREGSLQPGLRLPQAELSRKSNQVASGQFGGSNPTMPNQPVPSLQAMFRFAKIGATFREWRDDADTLRRIFLNFW